MTISTSDQEKCGNKQQARGRNWRKKSSRSILKSQPQNCSSSHLPSIFQWNRRTNNIAAKTGTRTILLWYFLPSTLLSAKPRPNVPRLPLPSSPTPTPKAPLLTGWVLLCFVWQRCCFAVQRGVLYHVITTAKEGLLCSVSQASSDHHAPEFSSSRHDILRVIYNNFCTKWLK